MEKSRADKNWANIYKVKGFKNDRVLKWRKAELANIGPIFIK